MKLAKGGILFCALVLSGCATSALIPKEDREHARSIHQFQNTLNVAARNGEAIDAETAGLLQAEAFYQYRLEFKRPNATSFIAQTIASAIEFAPLSVWATSSDVAQLRLQAYNGCIQLYESFLETYPDSKYKDLALYRLGWAYRNASIEGFPHNSEQVLAMLGKDSSSALSRFADEIRAVPYKSQDAVAGWSVIPGAGQFYVGKPKKGLIYFSLATGFTAAGLLPPVFMIKQRKLDWVGLAISFLGFVGLQVVYTDSYEDAQKAAIEYNETREKEFEVRHPELP